MRLTLFSARDLRDRCKLRKAFPAVLDSRRGHGTRRPDGCGAAQSAYLKTPSGPALDELQRRLGYEFTDRSLLLRALTHRSAQRDHNERLEFLGDALIGIIAAAYFYQRFPNEDEGTLSRLRSSVVRGESLACIAESLGLSSYLILGESERKSGGRHRSSILADALEALAGAVMLDASLVTAQEVVSGWLRHAMISASPQDAVDAKTQLQEWLQARGESLPQYAVLDVSGSAHDQTFRVCCELKQRHLVTEAAGASRRAAEKLAAAKMLQKLAVVPHA